MNIDVTKLTHNQLEKYYAFAEALAIDPEPPEGWKEVYNSAYEEKRRRE